MGRACLLGDRASQLITTPAVSVTGMVYVSASLELVLVSSSAEDFLKVLVVAFRSVPGLVRC